MLYPCPWDMRRSAPHAPQSMRTTQCLRAGRPVARHEPYTPLVRSDLPLVDRDCLGLVLASRRISARLKVPLLAAVGLAWIAACAAPCIGQAANPGPWLAPSTLAVPPRVVYCADVEADHRDGWSCDEDEDCRRSLGGDGSTDGPPSGDELVPDVEEPEWDVGMDDAADHIGGHLRRDGGAQQQPTFTAAKKFNGAIAGTVFKLGDRGLGYYLDNPPLQPRPPPRVISLDSLLGHSPRAEAAPSDATASLGAARRDDATGLPPNRRGRRSKQRKALRDYTAPNVTNSDDSHWKAAGLWAVDTVNPNSWTGAMKYLDVTAADAVLIQEARKLAAHKAAAEREAARAGWRTSITAAEATDAGGTTAGLAVAVRRHIGLARLGGATEDDDVEMASRVHVRWMGGVMKGGLHLITAWPHNSEGITERNLDILDRVAQVISSIRGPWVAGADWNMSPATLAATGWLDLVDAVAVVPDGCTCLESVIDYFVVPRSLLHAVAGISIVEDAGFHPHKPVRMYLRADARSLKVRRMRRPTPFSRGKGPPGCLPEAACQPLRCNRTTGGTTTSSAQASAGNSSSSSSSGGDGGDITTSSTTATAAMGHPRGDRSASAAAAGGPATARGQQYLRWLTSAEEELIDAYGLAGAPNRGKYMGRARGPDFVWECALGNQLPTPRYSCAASRKWRVVAQAAHDLALRDQVNEKGGYAHITLHRTAERALRRLATIIASDAADAGAVTGAGAAATAARPMDPITSAAAAAAAAHGSEARFSIAATARKAAMRLEATATRRRKEEWLEWLRGDGDASKALRRQHKFSRVQLGWVPTKIGSTSTSMQERFNRLHGDEAAAHTDIDEYRVNVASGRIIKPSTDGFAPLNAQEVVDDQAITCGEHWAAGRGLPRLAWPQALDAHTLPRPTVVQLRAALQTFPPGTALAWDALHPRAMQRLSDTRLGELIDLLMDAERTGEWPSEIGIVSIVLLPKPDGGWRPIGLFPAVVRIWMRMRREQAQQWEHANSRDFLYAGKGRGAQVAAWQHAQRAEADTGAQSTF